MCGIAGFHGHARIPAERIRSALRLMHHRGPDAAAARHFETNDGRHVHILHARLAIVDLDDRANQPMDRGPLTIAYNGEIYNHPELRSELTAADFITTSDTETLLAAIEAWGLHEALHRSEGMWAFALYDSETQRLHLARDRFGEKPLLLMETADGVYFASEPRILAALAGEDLVPDLDQVRRYLVNGYRSLCKHDGTFFSGVRRMAPASVMTFGPGRDPRLHRYWAPEPRTDETMTEEEAVDGIRRHLAEAVRIRLRADVPLAFCQSGGIDSNALIAIAKRTHEHPVHGFTIVNEDARYDERDLVDIMVRQLDTKHTGVPLTSDGFFDDLTRIIKHRAEPLHTISYYVHWHLMDAIAKAGYRVSMSGTGADELFTGYYDHHLFYMASVDPSTANTYNEAWSRHVLPIVRNPLLRDPDRIKKEPDARDHLYLHSDDLADRLVDDWREEFEEATYHPEPLRNRMLNELFHEVVPSILHEDDLNAMHHSIENRSPFLDRHLHEFLLTVPTRHLMKDGRAKHLLRSATADLLPDEVRLERRKVGFNAPILDLLDTKDATVRDRILAPGPIFDIVRRDAIESLLGQPELPNSESKFLFSFLCARIFLDLFPPRLPTQEVSPHAA